METALSIDIEDDEGAWAERGEYWRNFSTEPKVRGRKPRFLHQPLILSGHGLSIRVDRGSLLVRNGFTHYPQEHEETRYFPKDRRLPSRIVIIDGDGSITFDALKWLSIQGVSVVQIDWQGQVVSTTCSLGYGADPALMRVQLELQDNEAGISFARYLVDLKFRNAIETLDKKFAPSPAAELCIARMHKWLDTLRNNPPTTLHALMVIEAHAAIAYFRCWQSKSLQWKGIGKKLIPDDWHRIVARMTTEEGNQFARHPLNAILNYVYGMLEN